ncbi:MAG: Crp/Fnr family transcriptional regulator [Spirochaetota bacterium]
MSQTSFDLFITSLPNPEEIAKETIETLRAASRERRFERGASYLRAGEQCDHLAYVVRGLFRFYYSGEDGREYTSYFAEEGRFIPSYALVATGIRSRFFIEAMESSIVLEFPFAVLTELERTSPAVGCITRSFLVNALLCKEEREASLILDDGETRYREFLAGFPSLEKRIRLHHVASYLGLSPVSLSRIRRRMGIRRSVRHQAHWAE